MFQTIDVLRRGVRRLADLKREFAWVAAGQALSFVGAFASVKILTNLLTPAQYGELAIGITIAGCVQMYVYGPLGQVVLRFLAVDRERGQLPAYFSVVKGLQVSCGLLLLGVTLVTFAILKSLHSQWTLIALSGLLYGVVSGLSISFSQFQAAIRQRKIVALHQAADNWLRPLISVALLLVFRKSGYVALLGFVCATLIVDVSQAVFAWRSPEVRTNWRVGGLDQTDIERTKKEIISYAAPFVAWAGIGAISLFGDRWTLEYVSGAQQVGVYVALYQIASAPVSLTASVTNQLIIPIVFQRAGSGDTEAKVRSAKTFLFKCIALFASAMAVLGLLVYAFSKPLARIATSAAIAEWHNVLWVIFAGIVCYHLGQQLTLIGQIERQMGRYVLAFATNAVTTLVFSYFLAVRMGILGVAWALLLSNFAFMIVVAIVNRTVTSTQQSEAPVTVVVTEN